MATVAKTIADFLEKDLGTPGTLKTKWDNGSQAINPERVYQGQGEKAPRGTIEIKIRHKDKAPPPNKTGRLEKLTFELEVYSLAQDDNQELVLSTIVLELADEIVARYNGRTGGLKDVLRPGLPSVTFERAVATRGEVKTGEVRGESQSDPWRSCTVTLDLWVWE